jgi:S-DNA-T family DNA segregation ATPase FtsK/SpoIIIE
VRDGPHALVAGTTGAGKSELLQSLVLGLAWNNDPRHMNFVLIDYKGGAAFAECARLPHTVGLVTDLDPHLTRRALSSLTAELRLRERVLSGAGVASLDEYARTPAGRSNPLARLVIVVDEFAALAEELPEFVTGLIAVAQRGRSLGIHLVLATQRPGGAVSPEIRANTSLRIALRVTDSAESIDIVGSDSAAALSRELPGRAIIRTGETITEVQIARVGGHSARGPECQVHPVDEWGIARRTAESGAGETDLNVMVTNLCNRARTRHVEQVRRPWLDPLPLVVHLSPGKQNDAGAVPATESRMGPRSAASTVLTIGLCDLPDSQDQPPWRIDLLDGGGILVAGRARAGRSTTLRTIAASAAAQLTPANLHIHVIDCAGGAMTSLAPLPHVGTITGSGEPHQVAALLEQLESQLANQREELARIGAGSYAEAAHSGANTARLPFTLLLIDGWEEFLTLAEELEFGATAEAVNRLLAVGPALGLTIVVAGGRNTLTSRLTSAMARRIVLNLNDSMDYSLAGIPTKAVPAHLPPGRAMIAPDGTELQIGVVGPDPSSSGQASAIAAIAAATDSPRAEAAIRLIPLPLRVPFSDLDVAPDGQRFPFAMAVGLGNDDCSTVAVDLRRMGGRFLVCGASRSGRTTALRTFAVQASARGVDLLLVSRDPLTLHHFEAADSHTAESRITALSLGDVVPQFDQGRKTLIVVDDCERLLDTPLGDTLTRLAQQDDPDRAWIVAARTEDLALTFRGLGAEIRRARTGLLLQPGGSDGEVFGLQLPRRRAARIPGRGLVVSAGTTTTVQVAIAQDLTA